jgi:hypothetical protein
VLITDLDGKRFETREQARAELEKMGALAEPALHQALEKGLSLESRRRVEQILSKLEPTRSAERITAARAVRILELAATAEARDHLRAGSRGDC